MAADPTQPGTDPAKRSPGARAPRADALRNRDKLVQVARAAFAGADESVPLEGIARRAGVGIGTLYRHFPTREALVGAVYAAELDEITGCVPALLQELPPDAALRAWMERYAAFIATKRGMVETLRAGLASGRIAIPNTRERITTAIAMIIAEEDGITQANVEEMKNSDKPEIKRILGQEQGSKYGADLGVSEDWVVNIVKAVGNYGESFERNLGQGSPLKIKRGLNQLWNKGGILYAPPIR